VIAAAVRAYALEPALHDPTLSEDDRLRDPRFCIFFGARPSITVVGGLRLERANVSRTLADIRDAVRRRGHTNARWSVTNASAPADLADRLLEAGLVRDDRPGSSPQATVLVLDHEHDLSRPDSSCVVARRVETFEEFALAAELDRAIFGLEPDGEWRSRAPALWERERSGQGARVYLGFLDGEPVAAARARFCPIAVMLLGGGVLPAARGRGVYRALVAARRDEAVAAGLPASAVHASSMSKPILERLGFEHVGDVQNLWDPAV